MNLNLIINQQLLKHTMASDFRQVNDRLIQGEGVPATGDPLVMNVQTFPKGTIYVNNDTGEVFARNADDQVVDDWVSQGSEVPGTPTIDQVLAASVDTELTQDGRIDSGEFEFSLNGKIAIRGLVEYADNDAAILGGLAVGRLYHTAGVVKVVFAS